MRIVFIGAVKFSERVLEKLMDIGADIVGVVTKNKSCLNADFADLSFVAKRHGIPYKHVSDINEHENIQWIKRLKPDIIFCLGFSQMLKKDILKIAPMGTVGFHPTRLPANRGRHPIVWALALGLKKTASTFFFMDEGADSGDILDQEEIIITTDDNAETLYCKMVEAALRQIEAFLPCLVRKDFKCIPQDASKAAYWRKRSAKDGELDFRMGKKALYNLVRALAHPYAGSHVPYKGKIVKVWKAMAVNAGSENDEHGKVLDASDSGILVKCYDGALLLTRHEFEVLPKRGEYLL